MNQAIEEINKRKEAEKNAGDDAGEPRPAAGSPQPDAFAPVLAFDPSGANVENLVYKPSQTQPKSSREAQFEREVEHIADLYGVDKSEAEPYHFTESLAPIITPMSGVGEESDSGESASRRRIEGGESPYRPAAGGNR